LNERFLLVLESDEAARFDRGWPADRLLVAEIGPGDVVLHAYPASEEALPAILDANAGVPVHPARHGRPTILVEFHREAAILSLAARALGERLTVQAADDPPGPPSAEPGVLAIATADAVAAGLSSGDRLVAEAGDDGALVVRREVAPQRPRVHWLMRDLAVALAMFGAFALGLAGGR
jgi:hypothetical protein